METPVVRLINLEAELMPRLPRQGRWRGSVSALASRVTWTARHRGPTFAAARASRGPVNGSPGARAVPERSLDRDRDGWACER